MTSNSTPTQWDYIRDAILTEFPALRPRANAQSAFQFCAHPAPATWTTGDNFGAFHLADTAPVAIGNYYVPGTSSISQSYRDFLQSVASNGKNPVLNRALKNAFDPSHEMIINKAGKSESVPKTTIAELSTYLQAWTSRGPNDPNDLDLKIDSQPKALKHSSPQKLTSEQVNPFHDGRTVESRALRADNDLINSSRTVRIQAVGAQSFGITRTGWFEANILRASKIEISDESFFTLSNFFGLTGSLALVPTAIFVIYKPKVTITLDQRKFNSLQRKMKSQTKKILIMGHQFTSEALDTAAKSMSDDGTQTIVFDAFNDPLAPPIIVGVNSESFIRKNLLPGT